MAARQVFTVHVFEVLRYLICNVGYVCGIFIPIHIYSWCCYYSAVGERHVALENQGCTPFIFVFSIEYDLFTPHCMCTCYTLWGQYKVVRAQYYLSEMLRSKHIQNESGKLYIIHQLPTDMSIYVH